MGAAVGMVVGLAVGATLSLAVGTGVAVAVGRIGAAVADVPQANIAVRKAKITTVGIAGGRPTMPDSY